MDVLHCSGRILDGERQHLLSGHVSEILLHEGDHNWLRCGLRARAAERQGDDEQRAEDAFHGALLRFANSESGRL
jgi:hypothetical protein